MSRDLTKIFETIHGHLIKLMKFIIIFNKSFLLRGFDNFFNFSKSDSILQKIKSSSLNKHFNSVERGC